MLNSELKSKEQHDKKASHFNTHLLVCGMASLHSTLTVGLQIDLHCPEKEIKTLQLVAETKLSSHTNELLFSSM